ncbi:MAG: class II aldolase/adducin family protein [Rhodospirillales bacterium]|nr:class II aldolase/adducin family protein [Rhodospirillales bacterium]
MKTDTTEKILRRQVAACTRMLHAHGILGYSGHVSVRLPGTDRLLIQSFDRSRAELSPEDLLVVDLDGGVIEAPKNTKPPSELVIHTAILKARPDVEAVLHCHPETATLFTLLEDQPLIPVKNHAIRWADGVPVHPDPGHISSPEQGRDLAATLGKGAACLLRAHGAVLVAESVPALLVDGVHFEENAEALSRTLMMGRAKPLSEDEIAAMRGSFNRERHVAKLWIYYLGLAQGDGTLPEGWAKGL